MKLGPIESEKIKMSDVLQPEGWKRPSGYANGMRAGGDLIFVAGQIGWNAECQFETDDLVGQVAQALRNVLAILREGGAGPEHVTSMTWYLVDKQDYLANVKAIGAVWRDIMGKHFPTMAVVQVVALIEDRAKVEIQAHAVLPRE